MKIAKSALFALSLIGAGAVVTVSAEAKGPGFTGGPSSFGNGNSQASPRPFSSDPDTSNKGGAVRGVERADDVAGSHGDQGRTDAATQQHQYQQQHQHQQRFQHGKND